VGPGNATSRRADDLDGGDFRLGPLGRGLALQAQAATGKIPRSRAARRRGGWSGPITHQSKPCACRACAGVAVLCLIPAAASIEFDPLAKVLILVLIVLSLGFHEAAHAWTAWRLGDPTGKDMGRITLNPIPHIDLYLTIALPLLCVLTNMPVIGGAKPVLVNEHRFRNPWFDMAVVAFAGPLSNFILAFFFAFLAKLAVTTGYYNGAAEFPIDRYQDLLPSVLAYVAGSNALLFLFNLIPIPPLDGSKVAAQSLPDSVREPYLKIGFMGLFLIYALLNFVPGFQRFFWSAEGHVDNVVDTIVSLGGRW
jgi:Zn-dependent protease